MKTYVSHKRVKAAQIVGVGDSQDGSHRLVLDNGAFVHCDKEMFARYIPSAGDYLVEYEDGYRSISPKKAFEDGYSLYVEQDPNVQSKPE